MELLTHALLGANGVAALGSAGEHRLPRHHTLLLGITGAVFPDVDFAAFPLDPLRFLADWHQGPTHSLVLLPLWAVLLAGGYVALTGRTAAYVPAAFLAAIGLLSHVMLDLLTAYGTALWYPLGAARASLATTFIVDPVLTAIVLAGLLGSLRSRHPRWARGALVALAAYVALQAHLQQRAIEIGRKAAAAANVEVEAIAALPQPLSPLRWKLILSDARHHRVAHLDLAGISLPIPALPGLRWLERMESDYRAPSELRWELRPRPGRPHAADTVAETLWRDPRLAPFRRFARHPAISRTDGPLPARCVWFTDLRYDLPGLPDTFRYGFCRSSPEAPWTLHRLRYFSQRAPQALE